MEECRRSGGDGRYLLVAGGESDDVRARGGRSPARDVSRAHLSQPSVEAALVGRSGAPDSSLGSAKPRQHGQPAHSGMTSPSSELQKRDAVDRARPTASRGLRELAHDRVAAGVA